jgi:tetratricopeptide (TPR) repeat protein
VGAPPDSDGRAIQGYQPVHRVAQSFLGPLWIATDTRDGGGGALRLLRRLYLPSDAPEAARRAIAAVGQQALRLKHDNVLGVVDVLEQDGLIAFAYEHLEAEPLRSLQSWANLRCLSFPVGVSLRIIIDLLRGVEATHRTYGTDAPAVFGGLSPDSVLVARDGTTRLSDPLISGCASLLEAIGFSTAKLAYAAPEQIHAVAPLTPQCDVFTCGAMLWELLATRRLLSGSRPAIERKLLEHDLPSLKEHVASSTTVTAALVSLVDRSMAGDAAKRPRSAGEMADQLAASGHAVASLAEVAHFVGKLSGQRFDRRTAAVRSKSLPHLAAPVEMPLEVASTPGAQRRGARAAATPTSQTATPRRADLFDTPAVPLAAPFVAPPKAVAPVASKPAMQVEASAASGVTPFTTPDLPFSPAPVAVAPLTTLPSVPPRVAAAPSPFGSTFTGLGGPSPAPFAWAQPPSEQPTSPAIHPPMPVERHPPEERGQGSAARRPRTEAARRWMTRPGPWSQPSRARRSLLLGMCAVPFVVGAAVWLSRDASPTVNDPAAPLTAALSPVTPAKLDAPGAPGVVLGKPTLPQPHAPAVVAPAPEPPEPSKADFSSPTLDDDQLVELFALERRSELPSCLERLGENASEYSGNDPRQSLQQLKAARREMMRGNDIAAHGLLCGAIAHDPTHVAAQQSLAELALQLGDPAQAKSAVERALARSPNNVALLTLLGDALALKGDIAGSRATWLSTLPPKGTEAERTRRLASSYRLMGDRVLQSSSFGQARLYYRRAVILTAGGYGPSLGLSQALTGLRHSRAGLAWAERAARAFPKDSRVQVLFGDALYESGHAQAARTAWQAALDVQPNHRGAARRLSRGQP